MQQKTRIKFDEIVNQLEEPLVKDDCWYMIDKRWFESCKKFNETDDESLYPGPIDNSNLFEHSLEAVSHNKWPLKQNLTENEDYILVPVRCWQTLKDAYGITKPNHQISRKVIETGPKHYVVEIYPLRLILCLYGSKDGQIDSFFSRLTKLEELEDAMRKTFNVKSDKQTKLWINSHVYSSKPSKTENGSSNTKAPPTPPPAPILGPTIEPSIVVLFGEAVSAETASSASPSSSDMVQTLQDVGATMKSVVTLEVINNDGTWPSCRPRFGAVSTRSSKASPGLCGLSNMGNTCFMNSALQCLSNTTPLTNYILEDKFVTDINVNNPLGMHGEIARTYAELIKVIWSGNCTSFMPREFKCAVSTFAPQFTGFAQQDCQELMAFLLDGLHEDLNRIRNKPYIEIKNDIEKRPDEVVAEESWSNYKKRNDSIVVDTFHALLKSTLVCPGCNLISVTFDPFCYLSLPLPVKREKQVTMTFIPAPANLDIEKVTKLSLDQEEKDVIQKFGASIASFDGRVEHAGGYFNQNIRPKRCKIQIPKSGPVSEICDIVARIITEERKSGPKVHEQDLMVAELYNDKISRIYEPSEHYVTTTDDIVVFEKKFNYVLPLYIKERKNKQSLSATVIAAPTFIHVPDLKFETIYSSALASLSNLSNYDEDDDDDKQPEARDNRYPIKMPPVNMQVDNNNKMNPIENSSIKEDSMVIDGDIAENGTDEDIATKNNFAFDLSIVNSSGNSILEALTPESKEKDFNSKLYLAATFSSDQLTTHQFKYLKGYQTCDTIETIAPKMLQKPTLQLKDCITQFTNVEKLGADDPWYCPRCKKHQQATKKFDIWSLPKVLIIHLKRFSFSRSWRDKIDTLVEFPIENLDMSRYVLSPEQKSTGKLLYNLIGVANHFGGLGGGHYTAFAKNSPQNSWYTFDDAVVSQMSPGNVVTRSAYVLFYQLQE